MRTTLAALVLITSACSQRPPPAAAPSVPVSAASSTPATSPSSPDRVAAPSPAPAPNAPLASLARTACYGFCPMYRVTILANGAVEYDGERFVKITGKRSGQLDEAGLARLKLAFATAKFGSLAHSYETVSRTDAPSAIVSLADGSQLKTVRHYHGDITAPRELFKLEEEIDAVVHIDQWIGTPEERAQNAAKWGS